MIEVPLWGLAVIVMGMFLFGVMCGKGGGGDSGIQSS